MNCAERLVEIFGSQADVARAFQLDRAVVHNWVKTGYVPARWAGEVERITQARISALEVINEASAKNPVRVKSRPGHLPFGLPESDPMSQYAPSKRIQSFHPPQRTLMGPGPTEIHPRVLTTMSQPAIGYLDPVLRHAGAGRGQVGRAGRSAEGRGRAEKEQGRSHRRLRARRDFYRLPVGCEDADADRAQARRYGDRRRGDLARRHAGE